MSVFRNVIQKSRFANGISATIATTTAAVSVSYGGDHQSVEEHQGCCGDQ
jgi:hypothetical protein